MCGRFNFSFVDTLFIRYSITNPVLRLAPHYNVAPGMTVPIVLRQSPVTAVLARWGLVPAWAKDPRIGSRMINARSETAAEKPSFRKPFRTQRCIIPANSFFEWQRVGEYKVPWNIGLLNEEIFSLAGLFDVWKDAEGSPLRTFTILTTEPNELMAPIHDRMPVILRRRDEPRWLDPSLQDPGTLLALLKPYPANLMHAYRIRELVNNPEHDGPAILAPAPGVSRG